MDIRTKKVGITGKYATRYGQKLRKQVKAIEILQRVKSICPFCGKKSIRREAAGIWKCRGCRRAIAGGAWEFVTTAATTAKTTINRLKKNLESRFLSTAFGFEYGKSNPATERIIKNSKFLFIIHSCLLCNYKIIF